MGEPRPARLHPSSPGSVIHQTVDTEAAIRLTDQAQFHPRKYLLALAEEIPGEGSYVFENTTAMDVEDGDPCQVSTDPGSITADAVVVATHLPRRRVCRVGERRGSRTRR